MVNGAGVSLFRLAAAQGQVADTLDDGISPSPWADL